MAYLVGLDLGTTNIKALVYNTENGHVIDIASRATPIYHPRPEWNQFDPDEIWATAAFCLRAVCNGREIAGLSISSMAEAGLPLDNDMRPLFPIISWNDRRTEAQTAWLEERLSLQELHAVSGQRVSTSFGVTKWMWIRDHYPEITASMKIWLSLPDYILWRLTGELKTDYSIASRTLLFDQNSRNWSEKMLSLVGLSKDQLPDVASGGTLVGYTRKDISEITGIVSGTPCVLGGQDHLCGALAADLYQPGNAIDSTGTAQAVMMLTPEFRTSLELAQQTYASYAYVLPEYYVLKGGLKAAGGGIEWVVKQLSGLNSASNRLSYSQLEALAKVGIGRGVGPLWLPHLSGAGSPEGDRYSMAAMVGVRSEHQQGDIFRGFLESLAFALRNNLEEMSVICGQDIVRLTLVGGAANNPLLSQLKADVLNIPVMVPMLPEASATGAALLAGIGTGVFINPKEAVESLSYSCQWFQPISKNVDWYARLYKEVYKPLYRALRETHHRLANFLVQ